MKLDRIIVKGFKSIRELDLELPPLNVLIGANGAGKSNFLSLFGLLSDMAGVNFQYAVARAGGADTLLHYGAKTTEQIEIDLRFGSDGYRCTWATDFAERLFFGAEKIWAYESGKEPRSESFGSGHKETELVKAAEKAGGWPERFLAALKEWKVYHFHDTSDSAKVKNLGAMNDNMYLRPDASNLAAFLHLLKGRANDRYELIRDTVRLVAPFFDDFLLRRNPHNMDTIRLEWREKGSDYPFMAHHLSDGMLRFVCLATLLLQPDPPSTILIDEPELGLHPFAITVLAGLLRSASNKAQVIVSTQSVTLANQLVPEEIVVVDRKEGQSAFRHLEPGEMKGWLDDYGLGDLWEKNLMGGRP